MRIISGTHKGRFIHMPGNLPVRPTTDFAKVALFNILSNNFYFEEITVLDLFSGTGGISYEFGSRGCKHLDSVELGFKQYAFIKKTSELLKLDQIRCYRQNAFDYLNSCTTKYDIIFADPPYDIKNLDEIPAVVFSRKLLNFDGWLILEHSKDWNFAAQPHFTECRQYGSVHFSIFKQHTNQ